ncbi:hypothetical protein F2Q69_00005712 [Brassica cretica]|uniref:Uncharacterized protein n=1 Tax=Brassica cretica TaxID=69181 RepID=A0A8S9NWQ3_BRACR|nr:hypothetical protein F2Q69_00005712 [Brassica cretica]
MLLPFQLFQPVKPRSSLSPNGLIHQGKASSLLMSYPGNSFTLVKVLPIHMCTDGTAMYEQYGLADVEPHPNIPMLQLISLASTPHLLHTYTQLISTLPRGDVITLSSG